nr:tail fiber [uncultured Mediterranean phage uvMED]
MAGYTRQSSAQIISGEVISASPLNAEYNQLLNAFDASTGHKHDGTTAEGPPIDRVADADQRNKVLIDSNNNELEFYVEQGGASEKQVSIKHEIIEPTTDNNVDLGGANNAFRNVHVKGTTNLVNTVITGTLNLAGISSSSGTLELGSAVNIDGGSIDGTPIGSNSASTISGTTITATTKFVGPIEGAVTGNVTGNVGGNLTGNVTGNVTASSGQSQFNDVVINGGLNMNAGSAATITNLTAPSSDLDAATKKYVDDEIINLIDGAPAALNTLNEIANSLNDDTDLSGTLTTSIAQKLPLAGGTMTGNITMSNSGKVTGLPTPSAGSDAANKTYADTKLPSASPIVASGPLTLSGAPTQNLHAATKAYVDTTMGSNNAAQTSATAAANSASDAQKLAIQAENSQYTLSDGSTTGFSALHHAAKAEDSATAAAASFDSFDDIYLGPKSSAPSVDNDGDALATGALYFDTTAGKMFVYDGSSFVVTGSAVNGTSERPVYVATAGQTTFAITHDQGFVDVYLNGLKLRTGVDFTDNNATQIVLTSGANAGDIVDIVAFGATQAFNAYTQTQSDARYTRIANNLSELTGTASTARANIGAAPTASPTFTGTVTIPASSLTYAGTSVTATGAELNKLAGATASTAELNKLAGVTATTAEINKLASATASTAELNHVTGVTSAIQTQLNAKASTGKSIAMAIVFGG